jgi:hypothetical protein
MLIFISISNPNLRLHSSLLLHFWMENEKDFIENRKEIGLQLLLWILMNCSVCFQDWNRPSVNNNSLRLLAIDYWTGSLSLWRTIKRDVNMLKNQKVGWLCFVVVEESLNCSIRLSTFFWCLTFEYKKMRQWKKSICGWEKIFRNCRVVDFFTQNIFVLKIKF